MQTEIEEFFETLISGNKIVKKGEKCYYNY